jgi:hypothetical protein
MGRMPLSRIIEPHLKVEHLLLQATLRAKSPRSTLIAYEQMG